MRKYRILVLGNKQIDSFAYHIVDTLTFAEHFVVSFSFEPNTYESRSYLGKKLNKSFRYAFNTLVNFHKFRGIIINELLSKLRKNNIDLVICTHDYLWPEDVSKIRDLNIKICLWFPDPVVNLGKAHFLNANYSALFFKEPFIVNKIRRFSKLPVYYLPECFNPLAYGNFVTVKEPRIDLVTYGSFYSWRGLQLEVFKNYNLEFYGSEPPGWVNSDVKTVHRGYPIFLKEKAEVLQNSKIVLNNLNFGEIHGLSARVFETAGIGCFQLFDFVEGVADIFESNECVVFRSQEEMKDLVDYYLKNPLKRDQISRASRLRVLRDHTYKERLKMLLEVLFESGKGFSSSLIYKNQ